MDSGRNFVNAPSVARHAMVTSIEGQLWGAMDPVPSADPRR